MIQVKEFLNYQESQEYKINEWLKEQGDSIEIVDIKYSVSSFNTTDSRGLDGQEFSGVLIIYKIINNTLKIDRLKMGVILYDSTRIKRKIRFN